MRAWTEAEQAQHRAELLAAIGLYDRPRSGRPKVSARQRRNLRHMGLPGEGDHDPLGCPACRARQHGEACEGGGCPCRCRAMLGLEGPFPYGDPTAPDNGDRWVA